MARKKLQILIGADPELFLMRGASVVSAHDLLPGTKAKPYVVPGGAIQVDGIAAEFNIDPCVTGTEFVARCQAMMMELSNRIPKDVLLRKIPAVDVPEAYFKTLPEDTVKLGCNPDYNAWTREINPSPNAGMFMRTASGHIHIGWTKNADVLDEVHFEDCAAVVRQLDYYLGVPSLMWDQDNRRRELYGKAGAFRPKPYGCEYRVLSNRFLATPDLMNWVYYAAFTAADNLINKGFSAESHYGDRAQKTINEGEKWWTQRTHPLYSMNSMLGFSAPPSIPVEEIPEVVEKPRKRVANYKYAAA